MSGVHYSESDSEKAGNRNERVPVVVDPAVARESAEEETAPNPVKLVLDRMHGRWLWAILLGCLLAPILAGVGYLLGPVKYDASAIISVESRLDTLVEETIETMEIKVDQEVTEQSELAKNPQVLRVALQYEEIWGKWREQRPGYAQSVVSGIESRVPKNAAFFVVSFRDSDPQFAADAVNAVVRAYEEVYLPNFEADYEAKVTSIKDRIAASRRRIDGFEEDRADLLRDSTYAIIDPEAIIKTNTENMQRLEGLIAGVDAELAQISDAVEQEAQARAEAESRAVRDDEKIPEPQDRVEPTIEQLAMVDSELPALEEQLSRTRVGFGIIAGQFGEAHQAYRRARADLEAQEQNFQGRFEAAMEAWRRGPGRNVTWEALTDRRQTLASEFDELRNRNTQLTDDLIKAKDLNSKIRAETEELAKLEDRRQGLDRERESIRQGRVTVQSRALPAFAPSSEKKIPAAAAGAFGGFAIAFGIFFLVGTLDQKTFGVRQLHDQRNSLRVLGVMPNMDEVEDETDTVTLATDCVHRIRARIESRRSHEAGYTLLVSSPFQGDGKTTLAVSLGWSYAESGYRTLLLDADFIGRAMTHQFGHLKDPGLREIIRDGRMDDEINELGHPNLSLLGVGFDRRISAANLSPRIMRQVIDPLRERFDLIIIDSGPITASIEAMPVASSVDGAVLALRRGRSRGRLAECIEDIQAVGADYLGVVLNYAERSDCLRYGSTSRMSASVQAALEAGDGAALSDGPNPMFGEVGGRDS